MSFTTIETVKKHILENHVAISEIDSEPVKIEADSYGYLCYPPIKESSEVIKAKEQIKPSYQSITFTLDDKVTLAKTNLIRDSVVVASDSSLGQIYQENVDYTVDYTNGAITRLADGEIPSGKTVSIWYMPYQIYARNADYTIVYETGKIKCLASGDIETGQIVYVDYISEYASVSDETIANAINEANEQVLNFIDSVYSASSDRSLVVAETYLTIAIICRIKAVWAVSLETTNKVSTVWSTLSDQYKKEAYLLLEKFVGTIGAFKSPRKA